VVRFGIIFNLSSPDTTEPVSNGKGGDRHLFVQYKSVIFAGDTQCALGERCISATEKDPVKVCIKICFYDAHCLGKAQNMNSCHIFPVCVLSRNFLLWAIFTHLTKVQINFSNPPSLLCSENHYYTFYIKM
jgi:hypothetical protein